MSARPLRLFLIRHGETAANTEMRYIGSQDDPLTSHGKWQATQLATAMAVVPMDAVYSSPLRRAADTAISIARSHTLQVRTDERLREGSFGDWEGMSRAEVLVQSPETRAILEQWETDPASAPPGGESLERVQSRTNELVRELTGAHLGQSIVLVSHVGPIKALLCAALGAPLTAAQRMFLDPATISVVDWSNRPVLRLFNSHDHLGWTVARWMNNATIAARQTNEQRK